MLKVDNISKWYGNKKGIEKVSFKVKRGSILGLLGSNGSGKTTTFRILLGLLEKDDGSILFDGVELDNEDKTLFGYLPEERSMLRDLKVIDQIRYLGKLKRMNQHLLNERILYWLEYLKIEKYRDRKIIELSKGNQQKVQLICALIHDPKIIIFDEPLNGLDIENVDLFQSILMKLKKDNKIILISSHRYDTLENFCDSILYLHYGDMLIYGDLLKLKRTQKICYINIRQIHKEYIEDQEGVLDYSSIGNRVIYRMNTKEDAYRIIKRLMKEGITDFHLDEATITDIIKEKLNERIS